MKKQLLNDSIQLTYQNEQKNSIDEYLLKKYKYKNKNTAECIPTKYKIFKNNLFSEYNNNSNNNKNYNKTIFLEDKTDIMSSSNNNFFRRKSSIINMKHNSKNNILLNLFKVNIKNKNSNF